MDVFGVGAPELGEPPTGNEYHLRKEPAAINGVAV